MYISIPPSGFTMISYFYHKLPSYIYSCLHLRRLVLGSCIFKPPSGFKGFRILVDLRFKQVQFTLEFKSFISNCPLLERLVLVLCTGISCLEINAPNLEFLHYHGIFISMHFENVPRLATVMLYENPNGYPRFVSVTNFLTSLPAMEELMVNSNFLKSFSVQDESKRLPSPLNHLKVLKVAELCFVEPCKSTLNGFPCNEANLNSYQGIELLEAEKQSKFCLNQLQKVVLLNFYGSRSELEFVKFLLAKLCTLKEMYIQFPTVLSAQNQMKTSEEVVRFPRASAKAEIIFEDRIQWQTRI
ncbi:F-box/FBD/LRR-repeat protein At1g13570-like [Jatropha curcas]|uniref:F-box/FBD/LRR-repeat protein At1g13570-like n=1 Tax=Jatropha curcas TaxID=180498 RepID=UPI001894BB36|nr:F-box/FBD/LRR-repeat protein At1g13570-like [Jatropha curcas]